MQAGNCFCNSGNSLLPGIDIGLELACNSWAFNTNRRATPKHHQPLSFPLPPVGVKLRLFTFQCFQGILQELRNYILKMQVDRYFSDWSMGKWSHHLWICSFSSVSVLLPIYYLVNQAGRYPLFLLAVCHPLWINNYILSLFLASSLFVFFFLSLTCIWNSLYPCLDYCTAFWWSSYLVFLPLISYP